MRLRLTSPEGWLFGTIFLGVGALSLVFGLVRWEGVTIGIGLVLSLCGAGILVATVKSATWIELDPEGFSVRAGQRAERVQWDELTEVKFEIAGKQETLRIHWRSAGREQIRTLYLSTGIYQDSHVESTLKWYWHHPERRFKLKRA